MKKARFHAGALFGLGAAMALILASCGGAEPTAAPKATATAQPKATATATAAPRATATVATAATATATTAATARPQASATTAAPVATPTAIPTTRPTSTPGSPGIPEFPQAKYGGTLTRPNSEDPVGWDPHQNITSYVHDVLQPMYDQLVQMNPYDQSAVVPQLATSWKVSADGLTWTFEVRKGVTWHNGTPLTAQDVKYTYENVVVSPPKGITSSVKGMLVPPESITTPDDYTVVMKLKEADASFLSGLAFGRMVIMSKAVIESVGREKTQTTWPPVGSGPFKAKGYVRGVSVEIAKNDQYYVKGRPFLNGMKFYTIPDAGTSFAAFISGQVNFGSGNGYSAVQVQELNTRMGSKVTVQSSPTLTWRTLQINALVKPFDDVRVRQAMAYAIDKKGVAKLMGQVPALGGYLGPNTGWELPAAELQKLPGYDADMKANVAKAKQLLADAGYPNGFKATFFTRNSTMYVLPAEIIQAMLKEVGIDGQIQIVESAKYFEEIQRLGNLNWSLAPGGLRTTGTDPNAAYATFHLPTGPRYTSGLNDPKLLELYGIQKKEFDPAKRKQKVWDMERYWLPLQTTVVFFYQVADYAWHSNVKNFQYHVDYVANLQFRDAWVE